MSNIREAVEPALARRRSHVHRGGRVGGCCAKCGHAAIGSTHHSPHMPHMCWASKLWRQTWPGDGPGHRDTGAADLCGDVTSRPRRRVLPPAAVPPLALSLLPLTSLTICHMLGPTRRRQAAAWTWCAAVCTLCLLTAALALEHKHHEQQTGAGEARHACRRPPLADSRGCAARSSWIGSCRWHKRAHSQRHSGALRGK